MKVVKKKTIKKLIVGALLTLFCSSLLPAMSWADSSDAIYKASFTANQQIESDESLVKVSEDATAIVMGESAFGFSSFERMNKGTNRA